jgi:hypothetical protein
MFLIPITRAAVNVFGLRLPWFWRSPAQPPVPAPVPDSCRLPTEIKMKILSYVITWYSDRQPLSPARVSREEFRLSHCELAGANHDAGERWSEPRQMRGKYVRVRRGGHPARDPLIFYDNHACRCPFPGVIEGLREVRPLLKACPREMMHLLRHDRELRSAELDVLLVDGAAMWTRWLRLPAVAARHLDTVRIRVRTTRLRTVHLAQDAQSHKDYELRVAEAEYSMLPQLLDHLWDLGPLGAWTDHHVWDRQVPERADKGSACNVVVDVVPLRKDEMVHTPERLCAHCAAMVDFADDTTNDACEDGDEDRDKNGDEDGDAARVADSFAAGLTKYIADEDQRLLLERTFAHIEIRAQGSLCDRGLIRLSEPRDFYASERNISEMDVRVLTWGLRQGLEAREELRASNRQACRGEKH